MSCTIGPKSEGTETSRTQRAALLISCLARLARNPRVLKPLMKCPGPDRLNLARLARNPRVLKPEDDVRKDSPASLARLARNPRVLKQELLQIDALGVTPCTIGPKSEGTETVGYWDCLHIYFVLHDWPEIRGY